MCMQDDEEGSGEDELSGYDATIDNNDASGTISGDETIPAHTEKGKYSVFGLQFY